jgi:hypothetical protein
MTRASRAEALFISSLQPSQHPTREQLVAAIRTSLREHGGVNGCAGEAAAEYGDHPDTSADRMRWALAVAA